MDYESMSDYEIKATVLGFHPEHGELIAASEAKEAIAHFNDIAKAVFPVPTGMNRVFWSRLTQCASVPRAHGDEPITENC